MADLEITYEISNRVGIVTAERPPVNALRYEDLQMLIQFFRELPREDELVVVFTTGGEKAFVAGHDVTDWLETDLAGDRPPYVYQILARVIYEFPLPLVCVVDQPAVGSGAILASLCDVCAVSPDASFALSEINVGLVGGFGPLRRVLPDGVVRHMVLSGEPISGRRAYELGMAPILSDNPYEEAISFAEGVASRSPDAVRAAKETMIAAQPSDPLDEYHRDGEVNTELVKRRNTREAIEAYLDDREPKFDDE